MSLIQIELEAKQRRAAAMHEEVLALQGQLLFDQAMLIARVEQQAPLLGCQQGEQEADQQISRSSCVWSSMKGHRSRPSSSRMTRISGSVGVRLLMCYSLLSRTTFMSA